MRGMWGNETMRGVAEEERYRFFEPILGNVAARNW